jgi:hypothetical protein
MPSSFVGADVRRMRIEDFVVRVEDDDRVAVFPDDGQVRLVAEVDNLLVAAVAHEDGGAARTPIGYEVDCALHGVEIAAAVGGHDDARGVRWRRPSLRCEGPAGGAADAAEAAIGEAQDSGIDLHVVGRLVLEQVVMRVDRRDGVVHDDRIEVKPVAEPADDRELGVAGRGNGGA